MPSIFEEYTSRVTAHAKNLRGRYELDTENYINKNFSDAPTYRRINVYREENSLGEYEVRVNMIERMGNIRNILLRPNFDLNVGNMARFEDRTWLLFDKFGHVDSGVKMTAMRTNYNLKWIDSDGVLNTKRCYASSSDIGSKSKQSRATIEFNKYDVKLPFGQLYVFIETTADTKEIDLNHRFIINDIAYEVIGLDNTTHVEDGYGIIQFTIKRVTNHPKDDFEFGIAHNDYYIPNEDPVDINQEKEKNVKEESRVQRGGGTLW